MSVLLHPHSQYCQRSSREASAAEWGGADSMNYIGDDESNMPWRQLKKLKSKVPGIKHWMAAKNTLLVSWII